MRHYETNKPLINVGLAFARNMHLMTTVPELLNTKLKSGKCVGDHPKHETNEKLECSLECVCSVDKVYVNENLFTDPLCKLFVAEVQMCHEYLM